MPRTGVRGQFRGAWCDNPQAVGHASLERGFLEPVSELTLGQIEEACEAAFGKRMCALGNNRASELANGGQFKETNQERASMPDQITDQPPADVQQMWKGALLAALRPIPHRLGGDRG